MEQPIRVLGLPDDGHWWRLGGLPPGPAAVDRAVRERHRAWRLTPLSAGVYAARPDTPRAAPRGPGPELHVVTASGPDAGRICPVPAGGLGVGRGASDLLLSDPAAPSRPVRLALTATGLRVLRPSAETHGASAATASAWDGRTPLLVGSTTLELVRGRQAGLAPHASVPPAVVDLGDAPGDQPMLVPALMAAAPLVVGAVLAVTTGSVLFLLLSLVSVAASAAMLLGHRRRRRRHAAALTERAHDLAGQRLSAAPGPAGITRALRSRIRDRLAVAQTPSGAPLTLSWGEGRGPFDLSRADPDGRWSAALTVRQPALTAPTPQTPTAVTGPPSALGAVGRWVLFQSLRHAVAAGTGLVECGPAGARRWWTGASDRPDIVLRADDPDLLAAAHRRWVGDVGEPVTPAADRALTPPSILLGGEAAAQGADHVDLAERTVRTAADARVVADVVATGVAPATLHWWLAELAHDVHLLRLAPGADGTPPLRLPERVGGCSAADGVRTELVPPRGPDGDAGRVVLDLAADGPHVLIAGTTGSGKSDLLTSVLLGLTAHHPPAELALILLDFKGGASFGPFGALPHTMSLETNHVGAASLRALQAIRAELRRREALFAAAGVPDYPAFRRSRPDVVLPRLVVAVDELRVLMDEHPDAAAVLQHLAATGRSLGFHLLLATQRAAGTVTGDLRSNLGSTIALRTATEQESWDLVGSAAAHRLDPALPGSAVLARPGRPDVAFRAARWSRDAAGPTWRRIGDPEPRSDATPWAEVLEELGRRCAEAGLAAPEPIVSPSLPARWSAPPSPPDADPVLALLDDASRARHVPWSWTPGPEGGTAWLVEPGGGRAEVLEAITAALGRGRGPALLLDGTGELAGASEQDGILVLAPDDDAGLGARVLEAARETAAAAGTLLVTGWSGWSALRAGDTYRSLEEELHRWLATAQARPLRLGAVGGRELATSRLLLHLPHRFYVPAGTSAEHRLVWPRLSAVESLPGRAVHVGPAWPEPGIPAQLAQPAASAPPSTL